MLWGLCETRNDLEQDFCFHSLLRQGMSLEGILALMSKWPVLVLGSFVTMSVSQQPWSGFLFWGQYHSDLLCDFGANVNVTVTLNMCVVWSQWLKIEWLRFFTLIVAIAVHRRQCCGIAYLEYDNNNLIIIIPWFISYMIGLNKCFLNCIVFYF